MPVPEQINLHMPGRVFRALFSPDGSKLALTIAQGSLHEVYVLTVDSDHIKRITYDDAGADCIGWNISGTHVLFRSTRQHPTQQTRIFVAPADGGAPELLNLPEAEFALPITDTTTVFVPNTAELEIHGRYRGGKMDRLWLRNKHGIVPLTDGASIDTSPVWCNDRVYFVSDRGGDRQLYSLVLHDPINSLCGPHTSFDGGIRNIHSDGKSIVFEAGDRIGIVTFVEGSTNSKPQVMDLSVPFPSNRNKRADETAETFMLSKSIEWFDVRRHAVTTDGTRAFIEARGQIFEIEVESGHSTPHCFIPGVRNSYPAPSPDGTFLALISDRDLDSSSNVATAVATSEEPMGNPVPDAPVQRLWSVDHQGRWNPLTRRLRGLPERPIWSPDGKWLALGNHLGQILLIDSNGTKTRLVDQSPVQQTNRDINSSYSFSPDSRWLVYSIRAENWIEVVRVFDIHNDTLYQLTPDELHCYSPVFCADSEKIIFVTNRDFSCRPSSVNGLNQFTSMPSIFLMNLRTTLFSCGVVQESRATTRYNCIIDVSGSSSRTFRVIPLSFVEIDRICISGTTLLVLSRSNLHAFTVDASLDSMVPAWKTPLDDVTDFRSDPQSEAALVQRGKLKGTGLEIHSLQSCSKARRVVLSNARLQLKRESEWHQILCESWRLADDFFWNPRLSGKGWNGVLQRCRARLPAVTDRGDLNSLISEMLEQLRTSHTQISDGDLPRSGGNDSVGYIGADLKPVSDAKRHAWRIDRVLKHDPFRPEMMSPLTSSDIDFGVHRYILSVDGNVPSGNLDFNQFMVGKTAKNVTLNVARSIDGMDQKAVQVKAISSEVALRRFDWIETRQALVRSQFNGDVGYVFVPSLHADDAGRFAREFQSSILCKALIIDVRYCVGGNLSDTLLTHLFAEPDIYLKPRSGFFYPRSDYAYEGNIVVLCNEHTHSNGEELCLRMRDLSRARLVGRRTSGGGVGAQPTLLMDGGVVRIPNYAMWSPRSRDWAVEGGGVHPSKGHDVPESHLPEIQHDTILMHAFRYLVSLFASLGYDGYGSGTKSSHPAQLTPSHSPRDRRRIDPKYPPIEHLYPKCSHDS